MRLAGEQRGQPHHGRPVPATPLTVELADELFARGASSSWGSRTPCVGRIPDGDLAVLEGYATRLAAIVTGETSILAEFLDASHGYHCHFVGLGGSPQLVDTYRRLGISALWRRAISEQDWRTRFDVTHHAALTRGVPRRRRRPGPPAHP